MSEADPPDPPATPADGEKLEILKAARAAAESFPRLTIDPKVLEELRSGLIGSTRTPELGEQLRALTSMRPYGEIAADIAKQGEAARRRSIDYARIAPIPQVPSASEAAVRAVEAETREVGNAIEGLASLIGLQGEIAARQEVGILKMTAELEASRKSSDRASTWIIRLTAVLTAATIVILYLTWVLANRPVA